MFHEKRKVDIVEVPMSPVAMNRVAAISRDLIDSSKTYSGYLSITNPIRVEIEEELRKSNVPAELRPVASFSVIASTLFNYGNSKENSAKPGCLNDNENHKVRNDRKPDFDYRLLRENTIGCCTDYAYIMCRFLLFKGYSNRVRTISGHVFNEFMVEGKWYTIDANTGVLATKSYDDDTSEFVIYYLPHYGMIKSSYYRPTLIPFREFFASMLCDFKIARGTMVNLVSGKEYYPY